MCDVGKVGAVDYSFAVVEDCSGVSFEVETEEASMQTPYVRQSWPRSIKFRTLPVEESTVDDSSPREARRLLGLEVVCDGSFGPKHRDQLHYLWVGGVAPEFGGNEALDTCVGGSIRDGIVLFDRDWRQEVEDGVLTLEVGDQLIGWVVIVDGLDLDLARKFGR